MKIIESLLTPNEYSRPQKKIRKYLGIVMHWTASDTMNAKDIRDYFDSKKTGMSGYGSAHFIVDQTGVVLRVIPEDEIAYHCGSSNLDPVSKRFYTDFARSNYGEFCIDRSLSPNFCTLGIEMCPTDMQGSFSGMTLNAAAELCALLCKKYGLSEENITTHNAVVGWKECPKLWVNNPSLFDKFKQSIRLELIKNTVIS